jgi:hypothetical protein
MISAVSPCRAPSWSSESSLRGRSQSHPYTFASTTKCGTQQLAESEPSEEKMRECMQQQIKNMVDDDYLALESEEIEKGPLTLCLKSMLARQKVTRMLIC